MTRHASLKAAAAAALLLAVPAARAETCKYEDAEGRIIYSNVSQPGMKKVICFEPPEPPPAPASAAKQKRKATGPADFPKVDAGTQKARDDNRRRILREELAAEDARLADARRALEEGRQVPETYTRQVVAPDGKVTTQTFRNVPKYEAKVRGLEDDVRLHERNIEALRKELGNLK